MQKKGDDLKDLKQFGLALGVILIVFGVIQSLKHRIILSQWFCGVGLVVLCLGLLAPRMLKNAYVVFLKVAHAIGWFNTRVILAIIYFLLVTPIGILMKIFGKDSLSRRACKNELSYWTKRQTIKSTRDQLEKQF